MRKRLTVLFTAFGVVALLAAASAIAGDKAPDATVRPLRLE